MLTKLEGYLIGLAVLLIAFLGWSYHERRVGEEAIRAADAKALAVAVQKAAAETVALQKQVDEANQEAKSEQAKVNSYVASHPIGAVRVCHVAPSGAVPQGPGVAGGTTSAGTGPAAIPGMPTSVAGPDIGPGLTALMQAAERLAVLELERQQIK